MSDNQLPRFGYEPTDREDYEKYATISVADTAALAAYPPRIDLSWKMVCISP
jgi:hypothetical protein